MVGFPFVFLPDGCRRGFWRSRSWFCFHVGTRKAGGAQPPTAIFSHHAKKKKQNADGEPSAPQPLPGPPPWGPEPFTRYFTRSLRQYLSWGLRRAMPLVFFIIIISHFKMRNKRIFNEPSQQACVCFILVSEDGGSREGLLVSLRVSALPPSSGEGRKRGPGGGRARCCQALQCLQSRARASL